MMKITLSREGCFWRPVDTKSRLLMQHCIGAELELLNVDGLAHVTIVAMAHGWVIEQEPN